jgi:hypothetical protein
VLVQFVFKQGALLFVDREEHSHHICYIVSLPLVPEMETLFKWNSPSSIFSEVVDGECTVQSVGVILSHWHGIRKMIF